MIKKAKIIQIVPCDFSMVALHRNETRKVCATRVVLFGLDEDGNVNPLVFDSEVGVYDPEEIENFMGYELEDNTSVTSNQKVESELKHMLKDLFKD